MESNKKMCPVCRQDYEKEEFRMQNYKPRRKVCPKGHVLVWHPKGEDDFILEARG